MNSAPPPDQPAGETSRLDDTVEAIAEAAGPLTPNWHRALATWPHPDIRHAWALRSDAPAALLEQLAATDPEHDVAAAALTNTQLPSAVAHQHAGRIGERGQVALACRADCPDADATRLLRAGLTTANSSTVASAAAGLAGKPAAQAVTIAHFTAAHQLPPDQLLRVLDPPLATDRLARLLADPTASPIRVRHLATACAGTDEQRHLVRDWLNRIAATPADRRTPAATSSIMRTELPWWCDPTPISDAAQADTLRSVLHDVATHSPSRPLLEVAATALPYRPDLLTAFASNPTVDDAWLAQLAAPQATTTLLQRVASGPLLSEPRLRLLVWARLEETSRPRPDILQWPAQDALAWPEQLRDHLEPLLGTSTWPVLDAALESGSNAPLGELLPTVTAIAAPAAS